MRKLFQQSFHNRVLHGMQRGNMRGAIAALGSMGELCKHHANGGTHDVTIVLGGSSAEVLVAVAHRKYFCETMTKEFFHNQTYK